jgi:hypothetical protein
LRRDIFMNAKRRLVRRKPRHARHDDLLADWNVRQGKSALRVGSYHEERANRDDRVGDWPIRSGVEHTAGHTAVVLIAYNAVVATVAHREQQDEAKNRSAHATFLLLDERLGLCRGSAGPKAGPGHAIGEAIGRACEKNHKP